MSDADNARPTTAYKVLSKAEMDVLKHQGSFDGSEVDRRDGYIHLSTFGQLTETVNKHFAGQEDLWIAAVDLEAQGEALRWEESRGGESFPHLYGRLNLQTVVAYSPLRRDEDGTVLEPVTF